MAKDLPQPSQLFPQIRAVNLARRPWEDVYHFILTKPWWQFIALAGAAFLTLNALFAGLYLLEPGAIANARPGSYEDAFYFSVQSLATIGYGGMMPSTRYGHLVVTVEAFTGLLFVALLTGLTFAKFARPTSRVTFTSRMVVTPRYGVPHLMIRMANARQNLVVEAQLRVIVLVVERTPEGETMRKPVELKLLRDRTALFTLTWTAMHRIDEDSPFFGPGAMERLRAQQAEIFLSLSGLDETFAQTIHARHRYTLDDIAWNHRFADVLLVLPDNTRVIDYARFHEVVPLEPPPPASSDGARPQSE